jgi:hypothetical protein
MPIVSAGGTAHTRGPVDDLLAPEINRRIRRLIEPFAQGDSPSVRYPFVCECGCMGQVRLTLAQFDAAHGAYLDGHLPRHTARLAG